MNHRARRFIQGGLPPGADKRIWEDSFNCPQCGALAQQDWFDGGIEEGPKKKFGAISLFWISKCYSCKEYAFWLGWKLVFPNTKISVNKPNKDLNADIKKDYIEAAAILGVSPRGAAALLRLCIQKICIQVGEKGKKIDDDIANLVKKGLDVKVQKALDIVRVIGNEAVHPGQIDLNDALDTATKLFKLVNLIADSMITQPKEIAALYEVLPKSKKDGIEKRNQKVLEQ
jgi:hypothetical protein